MLTIEQKNKVLQYLNKLNPEIYSSENIIAGTRWYSKYIDEQLEKDYSERNKEVVSILDELTSIDSQLTKSRNRFKVTSLGQNEINLNRNEVNQLKTERFRYIREMADLLKLPLSPY